MHTIGNEYQDFGGDFEILHHSQLINELINSGQLNLNGDANGKITFHDPCYLGRQNDIIKEPRLVLNEVHAENIEMPRHGMKSFCCGAGGAQMWKEEEEGDERVSANRFREAQETGADTLAVGCPFCMIMLTDAKNSAGSGLKLLDIAEIVAQSLKE